MIRPLIEGVLLGVKLAHALHDTRPAPAPEPVVEHVVPWPARILIQQSLELLATVEAAAFEEIVPESILERARAMRAAVEEHVQLT